MLALMLFAVGAVEYLLAGWWTRAVVSRRAAATAAVTFVNVMLWGFVITSLDPAEPWLLVVHGAGCALGSAAACRIDVERPTAALDPPAELSASGPPPRAAEARRAPAPPPGRW